MAIIRVGDTFETPSGEVIVVKYKGWREITVRFDTGYTCVCNASNLRRGEVRDPYAPMVCGVGFIGEGKYSKRANPKLYALWAAMLWRTQHRHRSYKDTKVHRRWYSFQEFCKDVSKKKNVGRKGFEFDKDLIVLGNRKYSNSTTSFVPKVVNQLLVHDKNKRSKYGVGVEASKGRYVGRIRHANKRRIPLGVFDTAEEAKDAVANAVVNKARQLARMYKADIDNRVYNTLRTITVDDVRKLRGM